MEIDRFEPLLDRYQSGETTPEDLKELEALFLAADSEKRRRLVERFLLEVHLHKSFAGMVPMTSAAPPASRRFRRLAIWAAAAALVLVVGAVLLSGFGRKDITGLEVVKGKASVDGAVVERIPLGTWFDVSDEATTVVRLSDDSRAELDRSSRVLIQVRPDETRPLVELSRGGGTFQVTRGNGTFRVQTPLGSVTALGTEFTVKLRSRGRPSLAVAVQEGTVQVDAHGKKYILTAGKRRSYDEDGEHNHQQGGQGEQQNGQQGGQGGQGEQ